jgi:hypothetical protein
LFGGNAFAALQSILQYKQTSLGMFCTAPRLELAREMKFKHEISFKAKLVEAFTLNLKNKTYAQRNTE